MTRRNPLAASWRFARIVYEMGLRGYRVGADEKRHGILTMEQRAVHTQSWAKVMLSLMNVHVESIGTESLVDTPALYVGNHVSYVDIPLLMSQAPVVFIAKQEISRWPVFGPAIRASGTVFVDRDSKASRRNVGEIIAPTVRDRRQSIAVFPSGTTDLKEEKPWRWKVFQISKEHQIPVIPFRITYEPLRRTAYVEDDMFATHLWHLLTSRSVRGRIEFHPPILSKTPRKDAEYWQKWTSEGLHLPF